MKYYPPFQEYDPTYLKRLIERKEKNIARFFKRGVIVHGLENLATTKDEQTIYVSNHKSQLDGLMEGKLIFETRKPHDFAHIVAATNMNLSLFKLIGYDLSKINFCWIDRDGFNDSDYQKMWSREVSQKLREGDSFLVYPEGKRIQNQEDAIGKMQNGFLREVISSGSDPLISPLAICYDHVYEKPFYPLQNWGRDHFMPLYYLGCALPVFTHPFTKRSDGGVYINFSQPKRLSDVLGNQKNKLGRLKDFLREEITLGYSKITEKRRSRI
jgi:1-acyl-sn-glycerol-3-phosphate acyltransferase